MHTLNYNFFYFIINQQLSQHSSENLPQKMLLILPSHRVLFHHGKLLFTLLPSWLQIQQYSILTPSHKNGQGKNDHNELLAILHYKTANFYQLRELRRLAQKISAIQHHHDKKDIKHDDKQQTLKINSIASQSLPKKMQVMDLFQTVNNNKQNTRQISCIISDKFGDIYQIPISSSLQLLPQNKTPVTQKISFMNSNLGIPRFIKHIQSQNQKNNKQYFILADEQNRIKIYNYKNSHEIVSIWFMPNMTAIECHIFNNKNNDNKDKHGYEHSTAVILMKCFDKITLQQNIQLHSFITNHQTIQSIEYPGTQAKSSIPQQYLNKNLKQCKYYTLTPIKIHSKNNKNDKNNNNLQSDHHGAVVVYLFETKILWQLFSLVKPGVMKSQKYGEIQIQTGKWDYLYAIDTGIQGQNVIAVAYGADVQMPIDINIQSKGQENGGENGNGNGNKGGNHGFVLGSHSVSLNKYQKVIKIDLGL